MAISVTAMSEIHPERAGLASGSMTTAHESGGALGVSILSAIALGAGAASDAGFADGYSEGSRAGAIIAGALALIAVVAVPTFPPTLATVSPGRRSPNFGLSLGRLESEDEEEHVGVEDDLAVAGGD